MRQSWTNIEASPSTPSKINIADALEISLADGACNLQTAATTVYAHVRIERTRTPGYINYMHTEETGTILPFLVV